MKILIACEFSGIVRDAFREQGHDAISCDYLPTEKEGPHYQGNVIDILYDNWDMIIAFPPCTYLCSSGLHWNKRDLKRQEKTEEALSFVRRLLEAPALYLALENPVGCISTRIRKPDQYIQPWQFGHNASKKTGLWLRNLPVLTSTEIVKPRYIDGLPRWKNQTDSGQNKLGPSETRGKDRGRTYAGIAKAMSEQWS
jgi:hypothetical protein